MNRLGALAPSDLFDETRDAGIAVRGFMSHLACADETKHFLNPMQARDFSRTCNRISPNLSRSLLNSAGMITMPECAFEWVRPGIALYGSEPIPEQPLGLRPVMTLSGQVMQIRELQPGDSVSYGATYTAITRMSSALVSIGYADGVPWKLSNRGSVHIRGGRHPIVGRVCMDLTMVDVSHSDARPGDEVEFWGEHLPANEVAAQVGTISYTLFTGVGGRVRRISEWSSSETPGPQIESWHNRRRRVPRDPSLTKH